MAQDIKKLFEQEPEMVTRKLAKGHQSRFESKLEFEFPQNKIIERSRNNWMKIAASILILLSLSVAGYKYFNAEVQPQIVQTEDTSEKKINSMGDLSPDLKKIEDYYLANINYRISKIKVTDENRDLLAAYYSQLSVLQQEYAELNLQLNTDEISEKTLDALIDNLQMRLLLLKQLKKKLNEIDNLNLKENEDNQA